MEKLIDADRLKEVFSRNVVGGNAYFDLIDNAPPVEAIPKADYENRLKADMVAMLTEIQLEVHELWDNNADYIEGVHDSEMVIQQKIDALKMN